MNTSRPLNRSASEPPRKTKFCVVGIATPDRDQVLSSLIIDCHDSDLPSIRLFAVIAEVIGSVVSPPIEGSFSIRLHWGAFICSELHLIRSGKQAMEDHILTAREQSPSGDSERTVIFPNSKQCDTTEGIHTARSGMAVYTPLQSATTTGSRHSEIHDENKRRVLKVRFSSPGSEGEKRRLKSPSPVLRPSPMIQHPKKKSSRMAAGLSRQQSFDTSAHQSTQGAVQEPDNVTAQNTTQQTARSQSSVTRSRNPLASQRSQSRCEAAEEALTPMPRPPVKNPSPRKKPPHELTRLKSKLAPSSPLPAKRVARRTQHYECDTFSTLTRRRCVIAKRPSLKEALEVPTTKSQKRPTPRYTLARFPPNSVSTDGSPLPFAHLSMPSAVPENSRTAPKIAPKESNKSKTEKKPSKRAGKKREPRKKTIIHGTRCWNNVCDCVLQELLRAQPLVTLLEQKGKKIKFIINPEESADITTTNVAPTIVTNPENVEPDAEHEEPPRKAKKGRGAMITTGPVRITLHDPNQTSMDC
ncbi:hypothetical protein Q1695_008846 [Nippostrongylus brasiliensis]|nr:hypothetical protein Q1695_008846 [Nippostrongylus brasiliensis]